MFSYWFKRVTAALKTEADILAFETIPDFRETQIIIEVKTLFQVFEIERLQKLVRLYLESLTESIRGSSS